MNKKMSSEVEKIVYITFREAEILLNNSNNQNREPKTTCNVYGIIANIDDDKNEKDFCRLLTVMDETMCNFRLKLIFKEKNNFNFEIGDIFRIHHLMLTKMKEYLAICSDIKDLTIFPKEQILLETLDPEKTQINRILNLQKLFESIGNQRCLCDINEGSNQHLMVQVVGHRLSNDGKFGFLFIWDGTQPAFNLRPFYLYSDDNKHYVSMDEYLKRKSRDRRVVVYVYDHLVKHLCDARPGDFISIEEVKVGKYLYSQQNYMKLVKPYKILDERHPEVQALKCRLDSLPMPAKGTKSPTIVAQRFNSENNFEMPDEISLTCPRPIKKDDKLQESQDNPYSICNDDYLNIPESISLPLSSSSLSFVSQKSDGSISSYSRVLTNFNRDTESFQEYSEKIEFCCQSQNIASSSVSLQVHQPLSQLTNDQISFNHGKESSLRNEEVSSSSSMSTSSHHRFNEKTLDNENISLQVCLPGQDSQSSSVEENISLPADAVAESVQKSNYSSSHSTNSLHLSTLSHTENSSLILEHSASQQQVVQSDLPYSELNLSKTPSCSPESPSKSNSKSPTEKPLSENPEEFKSLNNSQENTFDNSLLVNLPDSLLPLEIISNNPPERKQENIEQIFSNNLTSKSPTEKSLPDNSWQSLSQSRSSELSVENSSNFVDSEKTPSLSLSNSLSLSLERENILNVGETGLQNCLIGLNCTSLPNVEDIDGTEFSKNIDDDQSIKQKNGPLTNDDTLKCAVNTPETILTDNKSEIAKSPVSQNTFVTANELPFEDQGTNQESSAAAEKEDDEVESTPEEQESSQEEQELVDDDVSWETEESKVDSEEEQVFQRCSLISIVFDEPFFKNDLVSLFCRDCQKFFRPMWPAFTDSNLVYRPLEIMPKINCPDCLNGDKIEWTWFVSIVLKLENGKDLLGHLMGEEANIFFNKASPKEYYFRRCNEIGVAYRLFTLDRKAFEKLPVLIYLDIWKPLGLSLPVRIKCRLIKRKFQELSLVEMLDIQFVLE